MRVAPAIVLDESVRKGTSTTSAPPFGSGARCGSQPHRFACR